MQALRFLSSKGCALKTTAGPRGNITRIGRPACHRSRELIDRRVHRSRQCTPSVRVFATAGRRAQVEKDIDVLGSELQALEKERDEAVQTAESCARTCMRLKEMIDLLDKLALEKVQAGAEEDAKRVLQEKASVKNILDKTNARATNNYALAAKLAEKIGQRQAALLELIKAQEEEIKNPSQTVAATSTSSSYLPPVDPNSSSGMYPSLKAPWEIQLEEARSRLKQAEDDARMRGVAASRLAQESIENARDRLRFQSLESLQQARDRIRERYPSAEDSIAEARERIRQQDQEMLEYCRRLVQKARRGEYVPEEEIEWAFSQLEKRL